MTAKSVPRFRTNPSAIARYFFHDCERYLWFSSADKALRQQEAIPEPEFDHSPLVAAILESGYQWEEEVVTKRLKGRVVLAAGSGELHTRRLSAAQTVRALRHEPPGRYLYQPTCSPPERFYRDYAIDPQLVALSDNHPDLVEVRPGPGSTRLLRVVDVKRGEALKLTHRVQILLYALELQAILAESGITDARVDLNQGAVWLGKQPEPELFDLSALRPHLERFLRQDLTRILSQGSQDVHWHVYPRCEWCEFFDHCRGEMREENSVSRLVQMTPYGKRHLRDEAGVRTLTELGRFLKRADADEVLDRCASLAGQRHRLANCVAALETREPQLQGASSPDLPQGENLALFLTLQREPLGQLIYMTGVLLTAREEVRRQLFDKKLLAQLATPEGKSQPCVWLAATPAEAPHVRRQFIELLANVLGQLHRYNAGREWKEQLSLQAYVHTEEERGLLFACLLEALQEPDLAEQAMLLLFHFQGPELLHAEQHPGSEVAYPVVVLQSAVRRLLALPVEVSYTLPEVLEALGSAFRYTRRDFFHFPLGHGLRAEALYATWYRGKPENLDEIRQQARLYVQALSALLRAVRDKAASYLVAWPPKFTLPSGAGIEDRTLSRLAFFARYESLLSCLAVRESRAEARPTQVLLGQVIELRARTAETYEVVGNLVREPEATGFPQWLLVSDTEAGRRAQVEFADYWYRNKFHGADHPDRVIVGVGEVTTEANGTILLHLRFSRSRKGAAPRRGERFLLYERFTDFNTDRVVRFLEALDQEGGGLFTALLENPEAMAAPQPLPQAVARAAAALTDALRFTPSQRTAYATICGQLVTAIWGPPGTGKTHFLAATILGLADAHAQARLPLRVLVCAYTHAAIENLLRKIAELQATRTAKGGAPVALGKAKYWQGATPAAEVVPEDGLRPWAEEHAYAVLGATPYACLKQQEELAEFFDLVVVDEASQVRVPEAAIPISLAGPRGRLLLAGDHLQLPPIVAGTYPDTPPEEPLLHRSIFEAVCPRGQRGDPETAVGMAQSRLVCQLLENFRMNDVLTSVAAHLLYGSGYTCFSPEVAAQRLNWRAGRALDPLVSGCLDPRFPLVVVILDGIRAAQANPVEADLVAQLVTALRKGMPYKTDAAFFQKGVFVVSPHHAQIQAIQRELVRQRTWTATPFVDTVDKMQGQEADAVVVSYGVADPEFALHEAEFIYGLNRLNVAVTRARSKCVVCLPRPLLDATPQVLDLEAAARGLAFMRRLVALAEAHGEELEFEGEAVSARLLRLGRPVPRPT